jgi:hypothetical protein
MGMGVCKLKMNAKLLSRNMTNPNSHEHSPLIGTLNRLLQQVKMPFWLQNLHTVNGKLKWTMLLNCT